MTTYTPLTDAALSQDKPVTQSMMRAMRDNPIAVAEGATNSPVIVGVNPSAVSVVSTAVAALTFTNLPAVDLIDFELFNLRPVTNGAVLYCQVSINNGSSWVTSGCAFAKNIAEVSTSGVGTTAGEGGYSIGQFNLSQSSGGVNNGSNSGVSGLFKLLNPSSTTLLKTGMWQLNHANGSTSGVVNVTGSGTFGGVALNTPINAIRFFYSTGNISAGQITVRPRRASPTN